jgi:DNA transformation protein
VTVSAEFREHVRDLLAAIGPLEMKRMFGGIGVYAGGPIFALIDDDVLFLKADQALAAELEAEGSQPFTYGAAGEERVALGYWSLPESAFDDADEAVGWARRAISVALAAQARKPKPKPRKPTVGKPKA